MKNDMMKNEAVELTEEALDNVAGGAGSNMVYKQCSCGQWVALSVSGGAREVTERCIACGKLNIFQL